MIINPTPITAQAFNGFWVTNLTLFTASTDKPNGFFGANLLPYDGTHLLATGNKQVVIGNLTAKLAADSTFRGVVLALEAECKRQGKVTTDIKSIMVSSNPSRTGASVAFTDGTFHNISDCFALAGTDSTFAGVFMATMVEIARQAGLTVS